VAPVERLTAAQVRRETSAAQFPFATTESLTGPATVIGQPRAEDALRFGVGMRFPGYNLFASGPAGAGKLTLVRHIIGERAAGEPAPFDWCYVNNFDQPYRPKALRLPAGQGRQLRRVVETLVQEMHTALATTFEGSEYQERKRAVEAEAQEQQQQRLAELQETALQHGLALLRTPEGLAFAPLKEGTVLQPEEFEKLPLEEQKKITSAVELMQDALQKVLAQGPRWERELRTRIRQLNREVATAVLVDLHDDIEAQYTELPDVLAFLQAMRKDVIDNLPGFLTVAERPAAGSDGQPTFSDTVSPLRRYHVNLLVDSAEQTGAPVVYESNPTYRPGRANGAYGDIGDRFHADQARRPPSRQRRLPDSRRRQSADGRAGLGWAQAGAAIWRNPPRNAWPDDEPLVYCFTGTRADPAGCQGGVAG
jgi:hypothetical protein